MTMIAFGIELKFCLYSCVCTCTHTHTFVYPIIIAGALIALIARKPPIPENRPTCHPMQFLFALENLYLTKLFMKLHYVLTQTMGIRSFSTHLLTVSVIIVNEIY
ncbi:hypothetical protein J3Q64DRAFT_1692637 [Phycomyces blakesleeanus]|uniref:Uncharacterized protein n=2 Tax=Phycomyces blakesleeanus TaxID=4837 RepID=A0A162UT52_PHYB8|nr:hypothetical protein PHYBLDRAFT_164643 [Phycomyces blakesleeanus NRRL 1555(-)]OAD77753.1 hypothetical protein PHYBLDRAFT_164643 [Phycomyces blakesleeanus NRRL 1555(-)]|eukprot:XP_018295793.1 hypothetical protein PHYBLDRAFT_164643 [Phycomyces blakesleeanus NRRL 1555(-)]